ncbi:MAG: hypothetical protein WDN47_05095 [Candidatus Doudnabacteria bacterium]
MNCRTARVEDWVAATRGARDCCQNTTLSTEEIVDRAIKLLPQVAVPSPQTKTSQAQAAT